MWSILQNLFLLQHLVDMATEMWPSTVWFKWQWIFKCSQVHYICTPHFGTFRKKEKEKANWLAGIAIFLSCLFLHSSLTLLTLSRHPYDTWTAMWNLLTNPKGLKLQMHKRSGDAGRTSKRPWIWKIVQIVKAWELEVQHKSQYSKFGPFRKLCMVCVVSRRKGSSL